jgi:AcrR family transcriptional regulator
MYEKSTVTIANILDAAESCFVAKNYNDVTMSEIAEQAEVTKGALYHHFAGKEALYLTMMHGYLEEIEVLVVETAVTLQAPVRDRLWQLTLAFLSLSDPCRRFSSSFPDIHLEWKQGAPGVRLHCRLRRFPRHFAAGNSHQYPPRV